MGYRGRGTDAMTRAALEHYRARMQRVLDHFHRQFAATFGVTVHRYVQLARMKRASYRLAFRDDATVTEIALDAGYDAADAFARAFRERIGQVPSAFRKSPDWE